MKILIIKLSSLGDLIHLFPAITELKRRYPHAEITWAVEEAFSDVPLWHAGIHKVLVVPLRAIKKKGWTWEAVRAIASLWKALRAESYDYIIDAQGLYKSALLARLIRGKRFGFAKGCCREPVSWLYDEKIEVEDSHALLRLKKLLSRTFSYESYASVDYGQLQWKKKWDIKVVLFAHGTTWPSKHYPDIFWRDLAKRATAAGYEVWLPYSNAHELKRAEGFVVNDHIKILPKMTLTEVKQRLLQVSGMIAVDTGLAHMAAMLGLPCITLYGPTHPEKIGTMGENQVHLCAHFPCAPCLLRVCQHKDRHQEPSPPCFKTLQPETVWAAFVKNNADSIMAP